MPPTEDLTVQEAADQIESGFTDADRAPAETPASQTQAPPQAPPQAPEPPEVDWSNPDTIRQLREEFKNSPAGAWERELQEDLELYGVNNIDELISTLRREDPIRADAVTYRISEIAKLNSAAEHTILAHAYQKLQGKIPELKNERAALRFRDHLIENRGWTQGKIALAIVQDPEILVDAFDAYAARTGGRSAQSMRNAARRAGLPRRKSTPQPQTTDHEYRSGKYRPDSLDAAAADILPLLKAGRRK